MADMQDDPNARITDRIQKLLDRASHPGTGEDERDTCLKMADALMHKHKIDQVILAARAGATQTERDKRGKPTSEEFDWLARWDEFFNPMVPVMSDLCRLTDTMVVFGLNTVTVVGYPEDIAYVRTLWLSTFLTFSGKVYPKWDPAVSDGMNIRTFAEAGYKWNRIWQVAQDSGHPLTHPKKGHRIPEPPDDNGWMKREMGKAYRADGLDKPKLHHSEAQFRKDFVAGFANVVTTRCWEMRALRRSREQAHDGAALVLSREANAVSNLFNELFPPDSLGTHRAKRGGNSNTRAGSLGAAAGRSVDMAGSARVDSAKRTAIGG